MTWPATLTLLLLWALLTGCSVSAPGTGPLRDPGAPLASQADAALDRLAGRWIVVAGQGVPLGSRVVMTADAMRVAGESRALRPAGPGRLTYGAQELWVLWLDADNRTAALGDPQGTVVWIMDRTGAPGDRLRAAREILTWYGYDVTQWEAA